ncbi:hypothetical protein WBG78_13900 [Chryseolinea sp. T2]|uniref:hypothetical protein n=1 Tax=Chryseolinea sp. T2 TaxID=3129255 RepID=UPI0030783DA4
MAVAAFSKRSFLLKIKGTTMCVALVCLFLSVIVPPRYREVSILTSLVTLLVVAHWVNTKQADELEELKALLAVKDEQIAEYMHAFVHQIDRAREAGLKATKRNEKLEQKVAERTKELKIRNAQLLKFAFMNSHEIRGPICRLMGLRNLLAITPDPDEARQLQHHISYSIDEMDQITRRATRLLTEACPFTYDEEYCQYFSLGSLPARATSSTMSAHHP